LKSESENEANLKNGLKLAYKHRQIANGVNGGTASSSQLPHHQTSLLCLGQLELKKNPKKKRVNRVGALYLGVHVCLGPELRATDQQASC